MEKILIILFGVLSSVVATNAQSITIDPNSQALIDAKNSAANPTKGILTPRLTTAQRISPIAWVAGTLVYDTDTKSYWYHNGTLWQNMAAVSSGLTLPYDGTGSNDGFLFSVTNTSNGSPWAISGYSSGSSQSGIGVYGAAAGAGAVGVWGRGSVGVRGTGEPAGDFEGNIKVVQPNDDYTEAEIELLRGTGTYHGSPNRDIRLSMSKYTASGYNNKWVFKGKINGIQSQPTDRLKIQYSTNTSATVTTPNPVYTDLDVMNIKPTGEVGIGIDPTEKLDINGNLKLNGKISVNGSFGNNGEVLTSTGASTAAQWKSPTNSMYNNLIIKDLLSNMSDLGGAFTLTKPSKIIMNLYAVYEQNGFCSSSPCPVSNFKATTCISSFGNCVTGQDVIVSEYFSDINGTQVVTGNAQKVISLAAGTYNFQTSFNQVNPTTFGNLKQNATQVSIQIIEN
jgi:hypothetical protein